MTKHELLVRLRNTNHELLKLSMAEREDARDELVVDFHLDASRQHIIETIRRLDPDSIRQPVAEELDVSVFNVKAQGAGTLLIEKLKGQGEGGSRS